MNIPNWLKNTVNEILFCTSGNAHEFIGKGEEEIFFFTLIFLYPLAEAVQNLPGW